MFRLSSFMSNLCKWRRKQTFKLPSWNNNKMMVCNYCKEKDTFVEIFWIKNKNSLTSKMISDCSVWQIRSKSWADPESGGPMVIWVFQGVWGIVLVILWCINLNLQRGRPPALPLDPRMKAYGTNLGWKNVCVWKKNPADNVI